MRKKGQENKKEKYKNRNRNWTHKSRTLLRNLMRTEHRKRCTVKREITIKILYKIVLVCLRSGHQFILNKLKVF